MISLLAVLPSIVLLIYIYRKDKKEKEPKKLLLKCFILGVLSSIPAMIMEIIIEEFIDGMAIPGSVLYAALDGFLVAAFSEELCKYLLLKKATWKSPFFNCHFDGIVYAVYVSLGFATLENIMYIADGGLSTAITRFFTAVPGHACDSVYMGYFYSIAKNAYINGDKKVARQNKRLALIIPIILHGIYDCLLSFEEDVVGEGIMLTGILLWIVFVIILFVATFKLVNKASRQDSAFYESEPTFSPVP
ncbi:MAG: PrsW family intramembrane metalloprotease [Lachnospiraceae bacterium]|nr:PrsW family intramembrane metalloprotease [Candidatus Colinaster scatohippi]